MPASGTASDELPRRQPQKDERVRSPVMKEVERLLARLALKALLSRRQIEAVTPKEDRERCPQTTRPAA
jgi:hypothetical protein